MTDLSPQVLWQDQAVKLTFFGSISLLWYDHAITFSKEVERIWPLPWGIPKILFLINRYLTPLVLTFQVIVTSIKGLSVRFCEIYIIWQALPPRLAIITAQALVLIRVSAIYGNSKPIVCLLLFLYFGEVAAIIILVTLGTLETEVVIPNEQTAFLPGCLAKGRSSELRMYASGTWIAPAVFELIVLGLTVYKLAIIRWRRARCDVVYILARDSLVYFVFVFTFSLANAILYMSSFTQNASLLIGVSSSVACLSVARMMINIRDVTDLPATEKHVLTTISQVEDEGTLTRSGYWD